jgi:hypothetical protein
VIGVPTDRNSELFDRTLHPGEEFDGDEQYPDSRLVGDRLGPS